MVWGVTGSGKTTFARGLAAILGVLAIQLDALFWKPNRVESDDDEFRANVEDALEDAPDGWVLDGKLQQVLQ